MKENSINKCFKLYPLMVKLIKKFENKLHFKNTFHI